MIRYVGTVAGLRDFAQPALRRCGMRGYTIKDNARQIQSELNRAALKDLARQRKEGKDGKSKNRWVAKATQPVPKQ